MPMKIRKHQERGSQEQAESTQKGSEKTGPAVRRRREQKRQKSEHRQQTTESRRGPARENAVRTRVGLGARPSSSVQDKT